MFTHPALLRQLNQVTELLRKAGEGEQARRMAQAAEALRRQGWTAPALEALKGALHAHPPFDAFSFCDLHERRLGSPDAVLEANSRLREARARLKEHMELPLRQPLPPDAPRPRSPDLA